MVCRGSREWCFFYSKCISELVERWLGGVAVTARAHRLLGMFIQWHKESKGFKNCLSRCVDDRDAVNAEGPGAPQSRLRIGPVDLLIYGTFF